MADSVYGTRPSDLKSMVAMPSVPQAQPVQTAPSPQQSAPGEAQIGQPVEQADQEQAAPTQDDGYHLMNMSPEDVNDYKKYLTTKGFSSQDANDYVQYLKGEEINNATNKVLGDTANPKAIQQTVAKAFDYPGGIIRTALAGAASPLAGKGEVVSTDDLRDMLQGKAPPSEEYLKRMGVSEGPKVPLTNFTLRNAEGLAFDIATSPMNAIGKLVQEVPVLSKLINSPSALSQAVGDTVYKSGLSAVDAKLAEKGTAPVSDILMKAGEGGKGYAGTMEQLRQNASDLGEAMGKLRQGLYDHLEQKGASKINLADAEFNRADAVIQNMKGNPGLAPAAQDLEDLLNTYKRGAPTAGTPLANGGGIMKSPEASISQLSDWKTALYDTLPKSAFDQFGKVRSKAMEFKRALAADFRDIIADAGNKVEPGAGDAINKINEKWGTLIEAQKPMAQAAGAADSIFGSSLGKAIDGTLLATGHIGPLAAKKALDLATTTYSKTMIGRALIQAGKSRLANSIAAPLAAQAVGTAKPEGQP